MDTQPQIFEIEERILLKVTPQTISLIKSKSAMAYAVLFMGLVIFIGAVVTFLIDFNKLSLTILLLYLLVAAMVLIQKRVTIHVYDKTIQTEYIIWKYTLIKFRPRTYQSNVLKIICRIIDSEESTIVWFELRIDNRKFLSLKSLNGAYTLEHFLSPYFIVEKVNFHRWK